MWNRESNDDLLQMYLIGVIIKVKGGTRVNKIKGGKKEEKTK